MPTSCKEATSEQTQDATGATPAGLEDYADLSREEIARVVLYLLVQEALRDRLGTLPDAVQAHAIHRGIPS